MKLRNSSFIFAAALVIFFTASNSLGAEGRPPAEMSRPAVDTTRLSPDLVSLGKLVQSDVDDQVVVTFIQNSPPKRTPTAEELVYLHELGLSSEAMIALMNAVPRVSLVDPAPPSAPAAASAPAPAQIAQIVPPLHAQRAYQPGGTTVSAPAVAQPQSGVSGNTIISSPAPTVTYTQPAPTVVYTQPAPTTVYVEPAPVVTYVEPVRPRVSFGFSFGHSFGHHHGGHWGHHRRHHWGHHGGHWGHRGHHRGHGRHH